MNKCFYIAELNLPSNSAYSVHVFQMCNALAKAEKRVVLIVPYINKNLLNKIKKEYGIKYNFKIVSIFKSKKELNFLRRIYFGNHCLKIINKELKKPLIISRSIVSSLVLAFNSKFNYLEIHHELKRLTKLLFNIFLISKKKKYLRYIIINKYLQNFYKFKNKDFLLLDDAVNIEFFKHKKKQIFKNTCGYFGSLTAGKGLEIIKDISLSLEKINFHIYGDLDLLNSKFNYLKKQKNLKFFNHLKYNQIPSAMSQYDVLLMPYLKSVSVRSNNLDTANYMSPLKLFEYLACGKIILASKLSAYSHILRNNHNSILIPNDKTKIWVKKVHEVFKNLNQYNHLRKNSLKSAKKYTWDLRVKKINDDFENLNLNL